jgi:hypothetical protein
VNIAFSAVVLALLLLPGALFRYMYLRGFFRRASVALNLLSDDLAWVLVSAIVVDALFVGITAPLGWNVDYHALLPLLVGNFGKDAVYLDYLVTVMPEWIGRFVLGVALCSALGALLGFGLHALVRSRRWDRGFLRFPNEWFYLFDANQNAVDDLKPNVLVVVGVELKGETWLYRGFVRDWTLDRVGGLDRIVLEAAARRPMILESADTLPAWYEIQTPFVILRFADTKTMAISYQFAIPESQLEGLQTLDRTEMIQDDGSSAVDEKSQPSNRT